MWQAQVFTLYPEVFPGPLSKGMYGKAMSKDLWNLKVVNIRDAAEENIKLWMILLMEEDQECY